MKLIQEHGASALSMRSLADELGVSPMAAYYYVNGKSDLLRLAGNAVLSSVVVPSEAGQPWDCRLRSLIVQQRNALKPFPGLREALRGVDLEERRRLEDAEFDILTDAGLPPAQAVPAFRVLLDWGLGNSFVEDSLRDPVRRRPPSTWTKAQRVTFDRSQMPALTADAYFEFGLDVVIEGIRGAISSSAN